MSGTQRVIKYVKYNKISLKTGNREESIKVLLEFFEKLEEKATTRMRGFLVMDSLQDLQESVVLTFWETKEDMEAFYQSDNKILSHIVEKLKPSFEQLPIRKDYQVSKFKV